MHEARGAWIYVLCSLERMPGAGGQPEPSYHPAHPKPFEAEFGVAYGSL